MTVTKLFGPPGTGKTTWLLGRMEEALLAGVQPEEIAFLTFTTKARREATARVQDRFGFGEERLPYFRTLHAIAYRELGVKQAQLVTGVKDLREFAELLGCEFSPARKYSFEEEYPVDMSGAEEGDQMMALDHFHRHAETTLEAAYKGWPQDLSWFGVKRFSEAYADWKRREGLLDFTDLLMEVKDPLPVRVAFVDEAQDLSRLQWSALDRLVPNAEHVFLAGDDDQAIFTWAGADPTAFLERPGKVEVLGLSYRLPRTVHAFAERIIGRVQVRQPKKWAPRDDEGEVGYLPDAEYLDFSREGRHLVLYRTHYVGRAVEERLRHLGMSYAKHGVETPADKWGAAIFAWERLRKGETVRRSDVDRIYEGMGVGKGIARNSRRQLQQLTHDAPVSMATLREQYGLLADGPWFEVFTRMTDYEAQYLRSLVRSGGAKALTERPRIELSSIHASKGGEADHVTLVTDLSTRVREAADRDPDPERRVFYVGATRARKTLTLVGDDNPLL